MSKQDISRIQHAVENEDVTFLAIRVRVDHRGTCWRIFAKGPAMQGPYEITTTLYNALLSSGAPGEDFNHMLGRMAENTSSQHRIKLAKIKETFALDFGQASDVQWTLWRMLSTAAGVPEDLSFALRVHLINLDMQDKF